MLDTIWKVSYFMSDGKSRRKDAPMKQDDVRILAVELPEDVLKAKWCGDFARAFRLIGQYQQSDRTPEMLKQRLEVEKEILERLPLDYEPTMEEAVAMVQKDIPDFTMEELEELIDLGKVDWIYIDGKTHPATRFYETLLDVQPDIARRAGKIEDDFEETDSARIRNEAIAAIKETGIQGSHIRIKASLQVKPESFKQEEILVHLPIPKPQKNMRNIRVISTYPAADAEGVTVQIGEEDQPQRTVAFREVMKENHPFSVEYEYDSVVEYNDLTVPAEKDGSATMETFTQDDLKEIPPHIRFTDTIKTLCAELSGDETDPLKLARKFYDYVTTKVVYSYMRTYFTLEEIPEYAALGLKGDCGVQALLFITLCRCAGIPARWQSGLYVTPAFGSMEAEAGMHDWAMFFVQPYGWLFADCSFGGSAFRCGNKERWNYYFGNLDVNRMAANDGFQAGFTPAKSFTRQDPYDSQVGEAEYKSGGLIWKDTIREKEVLEHRPMDASRIMER